MRSLFPIPMLVTAALVGGCLSEPTGVDPDLTTITYAPALGVDLNASTRLVGGLYVREIVVGTGNLADIGRGITVRYTGWLSDGTKFDENQSTTAPLGFTVGANQVIRGFDRGVEGMRVGGIRQIIIPPSLGYGQNGTGTIPGRAVLVFRVELVSASTL